MPVEIGPVESAAVESQEVQVLLFKDDGETLTLEGEIIHDFLEDVDFDPIFDDPEVRESGVIKTDEVFCIEKDGELEPAEEGTEGAQVYPVEAIDSVDLVQIVDADDLLAMFEWHVEHEMPDESLEDKARLAAARQLLGYDVDEAKGPFKKGDFRKMHKAGAADQVMRMLLAMINKESIRRVGKGTGYKKGDYKKHPAGYAGGTPSGIKKWRKYRKQKAAKIKKAAKKAKKAKAVISRKKGVKKAAPKKGAAKKLAKKGAQKGKRTVAASQEATPKRRRLLEGADLAGAIAGKVSNGRAPVGDSEKKTG